MKQTFLTLSTPLLLVVNMDWASFVGGLVIGSIVVVILVTPTGRKVAGGVGRATGERIEHHVRPKS